MLPPDQLQELLSSLDELLAPIPGDDPAGGSIPSDARTNLEAYRKETEADPYDSDSQGSGPEWTKSIALARLVLTEQSKHILVAAQLTEAYTKFHGWGGLLTGVTLLRRLVEECWDRLQPKLTEEDNDPELLAVPFEWLGVDRRGAWFPQSVRMLSLFGGNLSDEGGVTLQDFKLVAMNKAKKEDLDRVVNPVPLDVTQKRLEIIEQVQSELRALNAALNEKLEGAAPSMSDLTGVVDECVSYIRSRLPKAALPDSNNSSETLSDSSSAGESTSGGGYSAGGSPEAAVASRSQAYARLEEAANLLERLEPHSPIPYLIRRAVELGAMPFPALMRELIRDDTVLSTMNRELGIKEAPSEAHAHEEANSGYN